MVVPLWVTTMDVRSVYWQFFRQLSTHGQKFDPESLYEPI